MNFYKNLTNISKNDSTVLVFSVTGCLGIPVLAWCDYHGQGHTMQLTYTGLGGKMGNSFTKASGI